MEQILPDTENVVSLRYADLLNKDADLSVDLENGLGPEGMGIISVVDIPGYGELRKKLLPLVEKLAHLPEESLKKLVDPVSGYNFGWSHGAEKFNSQPDFMKGSFYANICSDIPNAADTENMRYPSQCRSNIWPSEDLPELERAFKEMGSLIKEVGYLLAYHCDKFQTSKQAGKVGVLESMLRRSQGHKGRLLHYYPVECGHEQNNAEAPVWCGWHTDFGSLTGLTAAMYTKDGVEVPCPDPEAGLYIKTNPGRVVKAVFDEDSLAYQIGETTEWVSGGLFHATPHSVQTPKRNHKGVARNTLAVFMQPSWGEVLDIPGEMKTKINPSLRHDGLTFGEYSEVTIQNYLVYGVQPNANAIQINDNNDGGST
ncbi:hypothetical protein MPTK1_1g02370 [Marchantia polymorpha subsp. ruderalis]|uniref:Non-haem dioxygenase N-terminal domain-containing protein n=2 Tax=Marchantia polymorpha TaxID=3197 RepID=A0AAF6AKP8_MARPO|nr:hypothetical protein MARPO_0029s0010 [Marchantia polymorpha]BBM97018.1 hypothetical protein Mp_1g02370 [Marchantia polymorpha subsp. ruderalis]|eukprot:PTQ42463.1 hypothetical protein MARPO_0029s0010 [Marchantia polymorpha]